MPDRPLSGVRVVVTRATDQASSLTDVLRAQGADCIEVPTIAVIDAADGGAALAEAVEVLPTFDWLVVTSANGAERVGRLLAGRPVLGTRVAAIGPGTGDALAAAGVHADLVPERFVAEGLLAAFPSPPDGGGRVLLAQAAGARPVLAAGLRDAGWEVAAVEAYRTVNPAVPEQLAERARSAEVITFTSASTVRGYLSAVGAPSSSQAVVCIGPVTATAAAEADVEVAAVAEPHTIPGLVAAVVTVAGRS